jgi:hypothetical protein|tara:strand:- start:2592 stop:2798 length:207 start_codon:yes stop_codon:yes gene_type:complete
VDKNRKFYKANEFEHHANITRGYMLRWFSEDSAQIFQEGPFESKEKALTEQNSRLINGVCSWLVFYGD